MIFSRKDKHAGSTSAGLTTTAGHSAVTISTSPGQRPRDDELDLFGLTHPGKVRADNQDHYLVCTVHPQVVVHGTSLPNTDRLPLRGQRLATVLLVADGVGGSAAGAEASQVAVEAVTSFVSSTIHSYHQSCSASDSEFQDQLRRAALEAHAAVLSEAQRRGEKKRMATTLTLGVAVWPHFYVVQVGDSRCYYWYDGTLQQITRDQTIAQHLVDVGALPPDQVDRSPLSHVLLGAIGGDDASPVVSRFAIPRGCVVLLCSDGLTKHVRNEEIGEHIRAMTSSEQLCRSLLELALERGGTDNITVLAGRARGSRAD